ncbi:MAG: hypothetical protein HYS20_03415 [Rhodocyclales bacterium]|nr:hypothetical protein [Rhodocyclales bacterium]
MTCQNLLNLVKTGALKAEPPDAREFAGLLRSGVVRLADAQMLGLSPESRFDLAYNAAHALALAALRHKGFRSENRYLVFQSLAHTLDMPAAEWRVLALCHDRRNLAEYEGVIELDERLLKDLLRIAGLLAEKVAQLPEPASSGLR